MLIRESKKLHKYVRNLNYTDPTGGKIYFNERREVPTDLRLHMWLFIKDYFYAHRFRICKILSPDFVPQTFPNMSDPFYWKKGKPPVSRCSDPCIPGSRKKFGSSIHKCCYECVSCPEGEISNISGRQRPINILNFGQITIDLYLIVSLFYEPLSQDVSLDLESIDITTIPAKSQELTFRN
ncbi:vomeronasal type-2 receptor 116-like [Rana temporaria]|uniref:vomeronasal type-2 receptor 116-like n=1 Tax=Rana temporaria TaxID=8407 RepID=UPI001AADB538|nr:vomeronasal type-2 receptor 116-like [Rana temporaria]